MIKLSQTNIDELINEKCVKCYNPALKLHSVASTETRKVGSGENFLVIEEINKMLKFSFSHFGPGVWMWGEDCYSCNLHSPILVGRRQIQVGFVQVS